MKLALLLPLASALAPGLTRRAALDWSRGAASAAALALAPAPSRALEFPTFGEEARIPLDLGPIGLKKEGASGKLNSCPAGARPCISSSDKEAQDLYVPPWTYNPISRRRILKEDAGVIEKADDKPLEQAISELKATLKSFPDATIVATELDGRYIRAEFRTAALVPGTPASVDDVEFLFALPGSAPPFLVNYRSASRPQGGGDGKRHRTRIKEIRTKLQEESGWASIGRFLS